MGVHNRGFAVGYFPSRTICAFAQVLGPGDIKGVVGRAECFLIPSRGCEVLQLNFVYAEINDGISLFSGAWKH